MTTNSESINTVEADGVQVQTETSSTQQSEIQPQPSKMAQYFHNTSSTSVINSSSDSSTDDDDDFEDLMDLMFLHMLMERENDHVDGWKSVPVHDPAVQDAANNVLTSIQQRSNSLLPYELQEIVYAQAEVVDDSAKFDMVLKVKRGETEEKLKVVVHKNNDGTYRLNHLERHP